MVYKRSNDLSMTILFLVGFRYTKIIVDTTAEELTAKVKHCEEQVNMKTVL